MTGGGGEGWEVGVDLPTSQAQSFFFFFWKRDFGSVKPQKTEREGAGARLVSLAGNRIN